MTRPNAAGIGMPGSGRDSGAGRDVGDNGVDGFLPFFLVVTKDSGIVFNAGVRTESGVDRRTGVAAGSSISRTAAAAAATAAAWRCGESEEEDSEVAEGEHVAPGSAAIPGESVGGAGGVAVTAISIILARLLPAGWAEAFKVRVRPGFDKALLVK